MDKLAEKVVAENPINHSAIKSVFETSRFRGMCKVEFFSFQASHIRLGHIPLLGALRAPGGTLRHRACTAYNTRRQGSSGRHRGPTHGSPRTRIIPHLRLLNIHRTKALTLTPQQLPPLLKVPQYESKGPPFILPPTLYQGCARHFQRGGTLKPFARTFYEEIVDI